MRLRFFVLISAIFADSILRKPGSRRLSDPNVDYGERIHETEDFIEDFSKEEYYY